MKPQEPPKRPENPRASLDAAASSDPQTPSLSRPLRRQSSLKVVGEAVPDWSSASNEVMPLLRKISFRKDASSEAVGAAAAPPSPKFGVNLLFGGRQKELVKSASVKKLVSFKPTVQEYGMHEDESSETSQASFTKETSYNSEKMYQTFQWAKQQEGEMDHDEKAPNFDALIQPSNDGNLNSLATKTVTDTSLGPRRDSLIITANRISTSTITVTERKNDVIAVPPIEEFVFPKPDVSKVPAEKRRLSGYFGADKHEKRKPDKIEEEADQPSSQQETQSSLKTAEGPGGRSRATSHSTISIGMSRWPNAQEVSETAATKLLALKLILFSLVLNALLFAFGHAMSMQLQISLPPELVHVTCAVVMLICVLVTNFLTVHALDLGFAVFASMLLTRKKGFSMAICGYIQTPPIKRLAFAQSLSLNSTCRRPLERVSYIWLILDSLKFICLICATGILDSNVRSLANAIGCIQFSGKHSSLRDKTYPTLESAAGVAEFVFGTALGCMRSEGNACSEDGSEFVFGPQLAGVVGSGDTIVGDGFAMSIFSECQCMELGVRHVQSGLMSQKDLDILTQPRINANAYILRLNSLMNQTTSLATVETNVVYANTAACGGVSPHVVPICHTTIKNIRDVLTLNTFQTDGTTASIALVNTEIVGPPLDKLHPITDYAVTWSLNTIWPVTSPYELITNVPGLVNALIYWTTPDLKAVDPTLFPLGIETLHAIILRSGLQRSLSSYGARCVRKIDRTDVTQITFSSAGLAAIYVVAGVQFAISLLAMSLASVWLLSSNPFGPVLRIVTRPMYFVALLSDSPFWNGLIGTGNAQKHVLWQQLDVVVRMGEALETVGESIGRIRMERPKLVKPLENGRMYA
ncbi:hypothetical protein HDU80_004596 [Chytriomyces hyalinus]|nr:hypothetical protein HDU80_004596 [Chytriomyces hyalinus]